MSLPHTPGPWRSATPQGGSLPYGAIVADTLPAGRHYSPGAEASEVAAYGGYLVAESVQPQDRPIIVAAPDLLAACESVLANMAPLIQAGDPLGLESARVLSAVIRAAHGEA